MIVLKTLAFAALTGLSAAAAGDAAGGAAKSIACQACHGGAGISISDDVPNLAGQKAQYLTSQLKAFKSGDRKHDVMNPIARQLSEADIGDLAAFWSSLPATPAAREAGAAALAARSSRMEFPAEFPRGFTVYRTDEDAAAGRVSSYYANRIALDAAHAGKALPIGSAIVVAIAPARRDANNKPSVDANGHLLADAPRAYSAMQSRSDAGAALPELLRNGNWTYGLFNADKVRSDKPNYAMCLGCHRAKAEDSFVFSLPQLRDKAKSL